MADVAELREEVTKYIEEHRKKVGGIRYGDHRLADKLKKGKREADDEIVALPKI